MRPKSNTSLALEALECREMLHGDEVFPTITIETQRGDITIELFDEDAPATVANFLNYVHDGDYANMFFHRYAELGSGTPFVLQGGGFTVSDPAVCGDPCDVQTVDTSRFSAVPTDPPVVNEFGRSNVRGTVAMAKLGGNPDSATSQFFVNLGDNGDNAASLDTQNGGFTVFGQVVDMTVVDEISAGDNINLSSQFSPVSPLSAIVAAPTFVNGNGQTEIVSTQSITGTAVLHGNVSNDFNGNGVIEAGEGGMFRRTVFVDANDNQVLDSNELSTETDERGNFDLIVPSGTHNVLLEGATDYGQTGVAPTGERVSTVDIGESGRGLDFGLRYMGTSWQNPLINTDVDGINGTTPIDALTVINELDERAFSSAETGMLPPLASTPAKPVFLDVVGNNAVGPLDANFVISNLISTSQPQAALAARASSSTEPSVHATADDVPQIVTPAAGAGLRLRAASPNADTRVAGSAEVSPESTTITPVFRPSVTADNQGRSTDASSRREQPHQRATDELFAMLGGAL